MKSAARRHGLAAAAEVEDLLHRARPGHRRRLVTTSAAVIVSALPREFVAVTRAEIALPSSAASACSSCPSRGRSRRRRGATATRSRRGRAAPDAARDRQRRADPGRCRREAGAGTRRAARRTRTVAVKLPGAAARVRRRHRHRLAREAAAREVTRPRVDGRPAARHREDEPCAREGRGRRDCRRRLPDAGTTSARPPPTTGAPGRWRAPRSSRPRSPRRSSPLPGPRGSAVVGSGRRVDCAGRPGDSSPSRSHAAPRSAAGARPAAGVDGDRLADTAAACKPRRARTAGTVASDGDPELACRAAARVAGRHGDPFVIAD